MMAVIARFVVVMNAKVVIVHHARRIVRLVKCGQSYADRNPPQVKRHRDNWTLKRINGPINGRACRFTW